MTLPPLPLPQLCLEDGTVFRKWYAADQMIAYATAAVLAERARCIAIVEKWRDAYPSEDGTRDAIDDLRSAV